MVNDVDLNNLNNEQMLQYIKKLQETLEQYKTREEASFMAPKISEAASFKTLRTQMKAIHMQSKRNAKMEDEESSDDTLKDVDWKLIRALQSIKRRKRKITVWTMLHPCRKKILAETFLKKFKLSSLDKYDGTADPRSHLVIFRITIQLQDVNDFVLCRVFPSTLTVLV